jgi:hypothetical protein
MQALLGTLLDNRVMEGKAHMIGAEQNPATFPTLASHMTRATDNLVKRSYDHWLILP